MLTVPLLTGCCLVLATQWYEMIAGLRYSLWEGGKVRVASSVDGPCKDLKKYPLSPEPASPTHARWPRHHHLDLRTCSAHRRPSPAAIDSGPPVGSLARSLARANVLNPPRPSTAQPLAHPLVLSGGRPSPPRRHHRGQFRLPRRQPRPRVYVQRIKHSSLRPAAADAPPSPFPLSSS